MEDDRALVDRLRRLGQAPIGPEVEAAHRRAMSSAVAAPPPRWRFGWKAVAAAALVGFLAGSTGLAAAGTLPDPAQDVAHEVLGAVGIDVPRSTEGCPDGTSYRNHGEYVAAVGAAGGDVEAAAHADCGMPVRGGGDGNGNGDGNGSAGTGTARPDADGDPCTGPPPWAGTHPSREARDAARAERRARCGIDESDEIGDAIDGDGAETVPSTPEAEEPATTTVVEATTTSTVAGTTTTAG